MIAMTGALNTSCSPDGLHHNNVPGVTAYSPFDTVGPFIDLPFNRAWVTNEIFRVEFYRARTFTLGLLGEYESGYQRLGGDVPGCAFGCVAVSIFVLGTRPEVRVSDGLF